MKKFTKILGFLGFFVTLVNVPIYAAHAVDCDAGQYLPGGSSACIECPGTANINGINQGVYCPGGKNFKENQNSPQGLSSCIDSCNSNLNNWGDTPTAASVQGQCKGTCRAQCSIPIDCTGNCHPIIEEVNGTINCGGACTVAPCNTVTCNPDQCEDWNGANECVPKSNKTIKYECTENGNDFGMETVGATYGRPYTVNPSGHTCNGSSGQQFSGWKLVNNNWGPYQTGRVIDSWPCVDDPVVFRAEWSAGCYEVSFNDNANGGHANSTNGTHESFYKKHNDTQYKWYRTSDCDDKDVYSDAEVNVAGHLPEKEHAKFSGYFEEPPLAVPVQIFNGFDDNGSLSTFGETWTIRGAVELIPHYNCVDPYVLDPQTNNCVARSVKVNYVCVSPIDDTETTYSDPSGATYGQPYTVLRATCSYSGYTLDQRYQWELQGYNNTNNSNDHGLYEPGQEMNEWEYLTYSPITEITFKLGADAWTPGNYDVEYRCGTINGVQVGGDPTVDSGGARYGQNYTVAHPSIPSDFINACQEDSGYSVKNWSFACGVDGQEGYITVADPYDTNDVLEWTYARNDCYFTANWEQSGFVIILNQNGATNQSDPADYLYTTHNVNVYLDSNRTRPMQFNGNPLDVKPRKDVSVNFYANDPGTTGATFVYDGVTYPNSNNTYASVSVNLPFNGFYQNTPVSPAKYINEDGFITNDGRTAGIGYDINTPPNTRTWVAEWDRGTVTLPNEVTWSGHTFLGWYCTHGDNIPYSSDPINATLLIDDTTTCVAKWAVACYSVDFDDTTNKGENAHNGPLYKIANDTAHKWFTDSGCKNGWNSAEDPLTKPTKEHAQFLGYNTTVSGDGDDIFNGTPVLTPTGETWEISGDSVLYAQYECIFPYHLDTDTGSDTYNECVTCDSGYFWSETNGRCLNCDDYMHQDTEIIAMYPWVQNYTWTSKEPYNWSIDQCYYECDSQVCESTNVIDDVTEQFLSGQVNQISFFGNEKNGVRTCDAGTGAVYCPQGLTIISGFAAIIKPMAAAVTFDDVATGENNVRYIIGNRKPSPSSPAEMSDGRVWSQVVSDGQQMIPSSNSENAPDHTYTYIIYPTDRAPSPSTPAGYEFIGYGYPNTNPSEHMLVENGILTNTNANNVIQFANGFETSYPEDMSPVISASRYLYPKYQQMVFNITYENMDNATLPDDHETTMPTTYTCGVATTISGHPTLENGTFAGWCTDDALTECAMTQTIPTTTCEDKTFYAKWECNEPYYHLNAAHDACEPCVDGSYWNGAQCQSCPPGWTSKSGFNWSIDQCYHECTNGARCTVETDAQNLTIGDATCSIEQFMSGSGTHTQIEFYGNTPPSEHNGVHDWIDVCGSENENMYCPYGLSCNTRKPRSVPVKFVGDNDSLLGLRFVVGQGTWESGDTSGIMQSGQRWSEFVGAGQKFILDEDNLANAYTLIVYPSYRAPDASWSGHEFTGYYSSRDATDDEQPYVNPYVESNYELNSGNANTVGTGLENVIPGYRALYAQYTTTCFKVEFNDTTNGGRSDDGTNGPLYVKPGEDNWVNRWYTDSTCETLWYDDPNGSYGTHVNETGLLTLPHTPQILNGHFIGYFDVDDVKVFQITTDNNPHITNPDGFAWTTDADTTLYARYECNFPYHLGTNDNGMPACVACMAGEYYDSETETCKRCDDELGGSTNISGWTSRPPYNWGIDQCYRECGNATGDTQIQCLVIDQNIATGQGMEQFLNVSTGAYGTQISFYGNERDGIYTCNTATGATLCPQGLRGLVYGMVQADPVAVPVDFHDTANSNDNKRWIVARPPLVDTVLNEGVLENPFTWTLVAGHGQQHNINDTYTGTYIIYPSLTAPENAEIVGSNFIGYNDRDNTHDPIYIGPNRTLSIVNALTVFNGTGNHVNDQRDLYAQYEPISYTLTYNCGGDDTGTPPESQNNIYFNDTINVEAPIGCSHWGNTEFRGWLVSGNGGTQQPGELQWTYDSDKTFTAIWGDAQVFNITYELNGGTNYNGAPNSYVYGIGATIGEGGLMPHRDYSEFLGWCDDAGLTQNCNVTRTISQTETGNKTFYAKWECLSPYHEAQDGQSCTWCVDNQYWDADTQTCKSCSTETNGRFPYSKHPFNFSKNQCYNYCEVLYNRQVSCDPASIENTYDRCPFEKVDNSAKQIEFYGNDQANVTACDGTVQYCAYGFAGCNSPEALMKPMTAPVDFNKKTTFNGSYTSAGTRYIFGSRNGGNSIDLNPSTAKVWSQIVGPGQKTNMMNNANNSLGYYYYTHIIYPTYIAPDATISDHTFNGYYDSPTSGDMHVGSTYILNATNARNVISDSDLSGDSNNPRTLYAQYCGEGQHSENGECVSDTWNVIYDCGTHGTSVSGMSMANTATYGENYTVAYQSYQSSQMIAKCEGNMGYVFNSKWKLNDTDTTVYNSNEDIAPWLYTMSTPIFTAQYDCAVGYSWQNGECKPGVDLCQAQLPTDPDPHATMTVAFENDRCVYTITCELCPNGTSGCYNHDGNQTWEITGPTTGVLPGSFCTPTEYVVTYDCGSGNGGTNRDTANPVVYNGTYTVLANGTTNGGVVSCSSDAGQFNGWNFNGDGNTYTSGNPISPWIYNVNNPTLTAEYSECPEGYVLVNNSQVLNQCMPRCSVECTETCPYPHADHCEYSPLGHSTEGYQNGETFNPDAPCLYEQTGGIIGPFDCTIIKVVCENPYYWNSEAEECQLCPSGYHINATGDECDPEGQYVITLNANIGALSGNNSNVQNKLYTIHNTGVYIDEQRREQDLMTPSNNPLPRAPERFATVKFYLNCNSNGHFIWNGQQTSENVVEQINSTFNGYYDTAAGTNRYIDNQSTPYITDAGLEAGKASTGETWWAQWTPGTTGFPNNPTCDGYTFGGWYTSANGGAVVSQNGDTTLTMDVNRDIYAHWNAKTITVTLDANGGIAGSNFLSTLYQQYDLGWSRNQSGPFDPNFYLNPNELPVAQNESLRFKGYYTQRSGGSQMIANDGHVVTAPTHATDETWYAQYETSTGPFTVAFRCNSNSQPFYTNSNVYVNNNIIVPANTNCTQAGMTFNQWKPTLHSSVNTIPAGSSQTTYQWTYNFSEVFEPVWDGKVYEMELLPGGGEFGDFGVTKLYEKYGTGWSLYQTGPFNPSITLSGNALPSLAGYNFAGYAALSGAWRGTVDNNVWTSPQPDIVGNEQWLAKYTRCATGEYYDDGQCKDCPSGYQLNPAAMSQNECYGQCDWYCNPSGCPTVGQNGVASCSYIDMNVPHSGINYWGAPQQCYTESQSLPLPMPATHPNCEHIITCSEPDYVYNPATDSCDQRKTSDITLLSHIFTDQGTVASPELLYTVNGVGVFLDFAHQQQMTNDGHGLSDIPTNYVKLTLNGNGAVFYWNSQTGNSLTGKAWLTFRGFYESQNSGTNNPMIGSDGYITQNGSNMGASYTQHRDWHAIWDNGSIEVPKPTRSGYEFDGWWTACNGGELKSMGNESVIITPSTASITWCAHWKAESYDVTYSCGTDPEWGGSAIDSDHPTYNGTYTVKDNNVVVHCSRPEYGFAGRWSFSEASGYYNANQSISWVFQGGNPTFTAQYEHCGSNQYVNLGACKDCPDGYPYHDYGATELTQCYAKDSIECNPQSDECNAPGVWYCTFVISGVPCKYYYPDGVADCHTDGQVPNCEIDQIVCKPEYTLVGRKCLLRDQYTITLDQNGGIGGQDKLYTIYQTNVYRDSDRMYAMSTNGNPLLNRPTKYATVTFKYCDGDNGSCESPVTSDRTVNVDSAFKGYYSTTFNGAAQYINSNYFITDAGLNAGKSYQSNSYTWHAQWNGGTVSPWPTNPTRSGYTFEGWWNQITGGTEVAANTTVSENVTWYAHWCEKCPSDIQHGTCAVVNQHTECAHEVVCDAGYQQNGLYCIPIGNLKLTYQPNGGTPTANLGNNGPNDNGEYVFSYDYGTEFRTLDYDVYTRDQHVLTGWERREPNNCLSPTLGFDAWTTYDCQSNATVRATWLKCVCTGTGDGFDRCEMSVENNVCKPSVYCKPGYVPNRIMACDEPYITPCEVSCIQCPAGTYQNEDQCLPCGENEWSSAGATQCETECLNGYHQVDHTHCEPNTIIIDWDENGGQNLQNGQCTYDSNLTLEQAPQNALEEAFLGWWLHNRELGRKNAGAEVQCNFDATGVYDGTSYDIQADWKHCECNKPLNPHVSNCYAYGTPNGTCECFLVACDQGYSHVESTAYTCSPECVAIRSNVRYDCGDGDGFPPTSDIVAYDEPYTVKNNTGCYKNNAPFVGWSFDGSLYAGGDVINHWTYTSDATFVAQYGTQCQFNEILINNKCVPCDCSYDDNSGVSTCNRYPIASNNCGGTPTCLPGYMGPSVNCTGPGSTNCTATCTPCGSTQISVGNTCEDCTCTGTGATCGQLSVTNNSCNWTPQCLDRYIDLSHNCYGGSNCNASCTECPAGWISNAEHTKCIECDGGTYQNGNECVPCNTPGYTSLPGSTSEEDCNIPLQYTIEYQANGGVNARTNITGEPEYQRDLTYNEGFVTYDGTIFKKTDSVVTNWDVISGGSYTEPKYWYTYYETGNTKLKAHWTLCECDLGAGASSCGMLSTDDNTCNWTNPVCQNGYVSPTFECTGRGDTNCTLTCGQCQEGEIIVNGECVPCTCTAGDGAASCTPGSTSNNKCTATGQCSAGYGNDNGNANIECSGTNCVVSYNKCDDGQVSNANCECVCCPENTYQDGNVCKSCPTGTTSPACSTSASACTVSGFTLVYRSNNGQNRTVRENYDYMQSFITKPGTTFAWAGHIMTQWDTAENTGTKTFADGYAELNRNYVYSDVANIILDAHWEQCTCTEGEGVVADSCSPLSTNDNNCGCNATCNDGLRFAGCNCNGTACSPVCEPVTSNAVYTCGSGTGTGYSESVAFGATYHIKNNAWCVKDKSTFAGWKFNGDDVIYLGGDTITWNYKTDREFTALWCPSCSDPADHCELLIPNPGECQVTCNEGYRWDNDQKKCIAKTDLRLTYQPNGGKPNQNITDYFTYGQSFTTKPGTTYTKARHIMTHWNVESGGEHTFTAGIAQLNSPYTYKTDGDTVLSAQWQECADGTIVIGNECVACSCTEGAGVVHNSCSVQSTDNNLCTGTVECQDGYVGANVSCDGAQCTATCNACQSNEVSVNGECVECECTYTDDSGVASCGISVVRNTCTQDPTCKPGYANPTLDCGGAGNAKCDAKCEICPAGTYGPDGHSCKPCPNGKTSYPGSTSINQCFIDPGSCDDDEHVEQGVCVPNVMECAAPDAYLATRTWNASIGTYGPCIIESCIEGYHILANTCVLNTCSISHGHGEYDSGSDTCYVTKCDPGYYESGNACVECENKIVDGDVAVSSYVSECEIAACMYQGQKYALDTKNNECVPICTADRFTLEDPDNPTGTIQWDERTKKCIRTCNPGYKMW